MLHLPGRMAPSPDVSAEVEPEPILPLADLYISVLGVDGGEQPMEVNSLMNFNMMHLDS